LRSLLNGCPLGRRVKQASLNRETTLVIIVSPVVVRVFEPVYGRVNIARVQINSTQLDEVRIAFGRAVKKPWVYTKMCLPIFIADLPASNVPLILPLESLAGPDSITTTAWESAHNLSRVCSSTVNPIIPVSPVFSEIPARFRSTDTFVYYSWVY
jgi:hypothetical protein